MCGAPCPHGGRESTRRRSNAELGWQGHCNRRVAVVGDRCWQHRDGYIPTALLRKAEWLTDNPVEAAILTDAGLSVGVVLTSEAQESEHCPECDHRWWDHGARGCVAGQWSCPCQINPARPWAARPEETPMTDWKPGDPCHTCGSTNTGENAERGGYCNGCGAGDNDDD